MTNKYFRKVLVVGGGNVGVLLAYALVSSSARPGVYVLVRNPQYLKLFREEGLR